MLELESIVEAIQYKMLLEQKKMKVAKKRDEDQKELAKLNQGKKSLNTLFKSKDGIVSKIT